MLWRAICMRGVLVCLSVCLSAGGGVNIDWMAEFESQLADRGAGAGAAHTYQLVCL